MSILESHWFYDEPAYPVVGQYKDTRIHEICVPGPEQMWLLLSTMSSVGDWLLVYLAGGWLDSCIASGAGALLLDSERNRYLPDRQIGRVCINIARSACWGETLGRELNLKERKARFLRVLGISDLSRLAILQG